jgi:hypothetical protein
MNKFKKYLIIGVSSLLMAGFVSAPPTPNNIATVSLAWDASTQYSDNTAVPPGTPINYKVYYSTSPTTYSTFVNAGSSLSLTVSNLNLSTTYYFVCTATEISTGLEGDYSNIVTNRTPNKLKPPGNLR